jgi:hypothetical protein
MKRPFGVKLLIPIQLALSALAIPSGILFLLSPNGDAIGAQTILPRLTQQVPFLKDFTIVGIFLLVVYGFLPIFLSYGLWIRERWAWVLTMLLGITEVGWITAEIIMFYDFGFFIFYPIIAGMGVATIALCILTSVSKFYSERASTGRELIKSNEQWQ